MNKAIFPGSFDPFTYGHLDVVKKACDMFDEVTVLICNNPDKHKKFDNSTVQRAVSTALLEEGITNCEVILWDGLVAKYAEENNIKYLIRGLRNNLEYKVYFSGIRENKNVKFSYELIEIKGWKILFCGITECINAYHDMELIDYVPPTTKQRKAYLSFLSELRAENPCDLFLVAVHTAEPEYVRTVSDERKAFFRQVLDAGVDIVWGNHPHVTQEWEVFKDDSGKVRKMIMYSTGNTISGQRGWPDYENPEGKYEYTGDSILMEISLVNDKNGVYMDFYNPTIITTHVESNGDYVIKKLIEGFINRQSEKDRTYYTKRLELMKQIKGIENEL